MNPSDLVKFPVQGVPESEPIDPYGKKKGTQSWANIIKRIGDTPVSELKHLYLDTILNLEQYGNMTLRELAVVRAYFEVLENPNPSMLSFLAERSEGKVPQAMITATGNIGDWMEYAKEQGIEIADVMQEAQSLLKEYNQEPKVVEGEIVDD